MNSMKAWFAIVVAFVFATPFVFASPFARTQDTQSTGSEEVFLLFQFQQGNVNEMVVAQLLNGVVYLPMDGLFRLLQIDHTMHGGSTGVSGFYLTTDRLYELDTKTRIVRIDGRKVRIGKDDLLTSELEVYASPAVFEKIFKLKFTVDLKKLQLSLETAEVLPVVSEREREQRNQLLHPESRVQKKYPLLFRRDRSVLRAGVLDYSLTAMREDDRMSSRYGFAGGAEVLGGELSATWNGTYNRNMWDTPQSEYHWSYAFDAQTAISQVALGSLISGGLTQSRFNGVSITNEPLTPRTHFQTTVIEEQTQPSWTVELYLNEQLTASAKADETGRVRFEIPLGYGTNVFTLRKYGPSGEVMTERKRLQVPFTVLPPGEFNYSINTGTLQLTNNHLYQAQVMYGLSSKLTNRIAVEFVHDTLRHQAVVTNVVSARVGSSTLLALEASPGVRYRMDMEVTYPSQFSYALSFTKSEPDLLYNPQSQRSVLQSVCTLPIETGMYYFTLRGMVNRTSFQSGSFLLWSGGTTLSRGPLNVTLEHRSSILEDGRGNVWTQPVFSTSAMYNIHHVNALLFTLNSLLLGASASYNESTRKMTEVTCDISSNIFLSGRMRIGFRNDRIFKTTTGFLDLTFDFDFARSSTSVSAGAQTTYTQSFNGALVYAGTDNSLSAYGRQWNDRVGANFRMFLDENGNNKRDAGEKTIDGCSVNIGHTAAFQTNRAGIVKMWELMPYTRYEAEILDASISNELWIPKNSTFSFMTDPHRAKTMNIPFVAVGMIEGTVFRMRNNERVPIPGLKTVAVRKKDNAKTTINLFQDGSLYYVGLAPGRYTITIDSAQLRQLGVQAQPSLREFVIKTTASGDAVSGLDFILIDTVRRVGARQTGSDSALTQHTPAQETDRAGVQASFNPKDSLQSEQQTLVRTEAEERDSVFEVRPPEISTLTKPTTSQTSRQYVLRDPYAWMVYTRAPGKFMVQISAWETETNALRRAEEFTKRYHRSTFIRHHEKDGKIYHAVQFGPFTSDARARAAILECQKQPIRHAR